jgi:hypothetical protein
MRAGRGRTMELTGRAFALGRLALGHASAEGLGCGDGVGRVGFTLGGRVSRVRHGVSAAQQQRARRSVGSSADGAGVGGCGGGVAGDVGRVGYAVVVGGGVGCGGAGVRVPGAGLVGASETTQRGQRCWPGSLSAVASAGRGPGVGWSGGVVAVSKAKAAAPTRLMQAHEVLSGERPNEAAKSEAWLAYYRRSAQVYATVAEIDRGHHHEALYWSSREEHKAREIEEQLGKPAGKSTGGAGHGA